MNAFGYVKRWGNPETIEEKAWGFVQKLAIIRFCDKHRINLVRFFEEERPDKLEARPALTQMLEALQAKGIDCAVVCDAHQTAQANGAYEVTLQVRFCGTTACVAGEIGGLCGKGEILNPDACVYR